MFPLLSIVGCGKLGRSLGRLWVKGSHVQLGGILNQSLASAEQASAFIGQGKAIDAFQHLPRSEFYLIGTPDGGIANACEQLAATGLLNEHSVVFHCSGALNSNQLDAARTHGASVASIHPIRSFARPEQVVQEFAGTWCGVEGDAKALEVLLPLFESIGAQVAAIDGSRKVLYHSAAVTASNYLVTLLDLSRQLYIEAGVAPDLALAMLAPLTRGTLENVLSVGPEAALTGPIARGDQATVSRQQAALDALRADYGKLYRQFAELTKELAARSKPVS